MEAYLARNETRSQKACGSALTIVHIDPITASQMMPKDQTHVTNSNNPFNIINQNTTSIMENQFKL